jgi:GNAT superfamily N-acetyltransferase
MAVVHFQKVETEEQRLQAAVLIREYLGWLNERIKQGYGIEFDVEAMVDSDVSDAAKFAPPGGRFYLVFCDNAPAGVGCLKRLDEGIGEVQRMYVRPAFRGRSIGRAIIDRLIADARAIGYRRLRLESLEFLKAAHALYRLVGFREIEPYDDNSMEAYQAAEQLDRYYSMTVFMELKL